MSAANNRDNSIVILVPGDNAILVTQDSSAAVVTACRGDTAKNHPAIGVGNRRLIRGPLPSLDAPVAIEIKPVFRCYLKKRELRDPEWSTYIAPHPGQARRHSTVEVWLRMVP